MLFLAYCSDTQTLTSALDPREQRGAAQTAKRERTVTGAIVVVDVGRKEVVILRRVVACRMLEILFATDFGVL